MTRIARTPSESGWYHVTSRGAGRRALFESDEDRADLLALVTARSADAAGSFEAAAWCLMDNHVHLLVHAPLLADLQKNMHRVCCAYASRFNRRNGHVGPVFQGRFSSFPIEDDAYLMEAVRYIHRNCLDKGCEDPASYEWCSYALFVGEGRTAARDQVIGCFGGVDAFERFHRSDVGLARDDGAVHRRRLNDDDAREIAKRTLGERFAEHVPAMEGPQRASALRRLFALGLSTRQIERLTGIGRSVIRRACDLR